MQQPESAQKIVLYNKAVNFFNEHPCVCSVSSFLGVISTSAKTVDLHDIAS